MLKNETQLMAQRYGRNGNMISTIFIGGGTPSLIDPELFTDWFNCLKDSFELSSDPEFSIECNPDSVSLELLTAFKELGVNRPVFGIQSFDAGLLKLLDRKHLRRDSYRAVYQTNVLGYHNFGVDLIFGLPGQTSGMLSSDIDELLELNPPHISYYQLTVEAETKLAQLVTMGKLRMPSDELIAAMYRGGAAKLVEAGYIRYEICSFAKSGQECRHNLGYWEGKDYLGLGPSAHSFIDGKRFANKANLSEYITILKENRLPSVEDFSGSGERMTEAVMLGLRTSRGVSYTRFSQRFGIPVEKWLDNEQYDILLESGHLIADTEGIRLAEKSICLADEITRRLLRRPVDN